MILNQQKGWLHRLLASAPLREKWLKLYARRNQTGLLRLVCCVALHALAA